MKIREMGREIMRENRITREIHYYTDSGQELALFQDNGAAGAYSKVLYFNSAMMISCGFEKEKRMTCIERAKLEFRNDFRENEGRHPGIPQSEYIIA